MRWMGRQSFEAPGVEPAFAEPDAKQKAIDYASQRFGGSGGEVHVYDATGSTIERKIIIDRRGHCVRQGQLWRQTPK